MVMQTAEQIAVDKVSTTLKRGLKMVENDFYKFVRVEEERRFNQMLAYARDKGVFSDNPEMTVVRMSQMVALFNEANPYGSVDFTLPTLIIRKSEPKEYTPSTDVVNRIVIAAKQIEGDGQAVTVDAISRRIGRDRRTVSPIVRQAIQAGKMKQGAKRGQYETVRQLVAR
jgi:hypothetical protein